MPDRPIICMDFDGVCHQFGGWKGADVIDGEPVEGVMDFIEKALMEFEVAVFSSRSNLPGGLTAMMDWFWKNGWKDRVTMGGQNPTETGVLHFSDSKPAAHVSIDDRAITFTGKWPDLNTIRDFMPWNKKAV